MRRIVIVVCVVVGIIILAALLLPFIVNVNRYRPQIQAELQQKLNRPVTLGKLSLRILPLSVRVNGITIGESPQFPSQRPFATANEVYASASLLSLLRGAPELKEVTLDNPQIELIRNAQGVWNYSTLGTNAAPGSNATPPPGSTAKPNGSTPQPSKNEGTSFTLSQLKIVDGQVGLTNQFTHQPRTVYQHINLTLSGFAPNKAFDTDLAVQFPGSGKQTLAFNGKVGPLKPGDAAATPVTGKISIQDVSLAGINSLVPNTVPAQTDAVLTGTADVNTTNEILSVKGNLNANNAVVRGYKVDYPIKANYDLSDDRKRDVLQVKSMTVQLGPTPVSLSGWMNSSTAPATMDLHVSTTNASLAQISQVAGAFSESAQGLKGTGSITLNVDVKGPADAAKLNYSGTGSFSNASLTSPSLTKPLLIHSANIQFAQNGAGISNLVASLGSTSIQGNLSATNFSAPQLKFALSAGTIDVGELEQITNPPAPAAAQHQNIPQPSAAPKPAASSAPAAKKPSFVETLTGSGTLAANTLKSQDIVLTNVRTNVTLNRGVIQLQPLTADLFGGKGAGSLTLDVRPATPLCAINAKLSSVDTNSLLSAVSSVKNTLYGTLAADANVNFALASSNELARTLNGTLGFDVANGELKNVNILNEISKVGKFVGATPAQKGSGTALSKLAGTFDIKNGVATTNNLVATLAEGSLSANGSLNLADQGLNMHVSAVLASGASKVVGGTGIGGYLNTALANNKGELVIPAIVTGTLAHPVFVPDVQAIAKMKLSHLLPTTGDPGKLASGILGSAIGGKGGTAGSIINGILGGSKNQQNGQQKQQPNNGLGGLLNKLGKKK
jgi:AsmA protein